MSQIDDLQAYVNDELPRRIVLLTVAFTGYDGDPNGGGAPAIIVNSPAGTFYLQVTPEVLWRKTTSGTWVENESGAVTGISTAEDLVFPIDYTDGSAVDASATVTFSTQVEIDDFLTGAGATNFKHAQRLWDNIPVLISHVIDLNFAAGIQRPDVADVGAPAAFDFTGKIYLESGLVHVNSADSSQWTVLDGPLTVLSHVTGSGDPSITFSGTPFVAGEHKGRFAVIDTGQTAVIHDNTVDTLFVSTRINPVLVDGVTTVEVAKPSTIFRNSLTDLATSAQNDICVRMEDNVLLHDVTIEGWSPGSVGGATFGTDFYYQGAVSSNTYQNTNVLIDIGAYYDTLGVVGNTQNGFILDISADRLISMVGFIVRNAPKPYDKNHFIGQILNGALFGFGGGAYFRGSDGGLVLLGAIVTLPNSVYDGFGDNTIGSLTNNGLIEVSNGSRFFLSYFSSGKIPEIRDFLIRTGNDEQACLWLQGGDNLIGSSVDRLIFTNCEPNCIRVDSGVIDPGQFEDGGGNDRIGIILEGPRSTVVLTSADTVTGTLGDLRIDGAIGPYGDLPPSTAPLITERLNLISRN